MLHALLGVRKEDDLLDRPWAGLSWEGFVIQQLLGALQQLDRRCEGNFFRTSDQREIDLVLDFGGSPWAMEVKLTATPDPEDLARQDRTADLIKADKRLLVSRLPRSNAGARRVSCNLPWLLARLAAL